jgi:hypothetical protein
MVRDLAASAGASESPSSSLIPRCRLYAPGRAWHGYEGNVLSKTDNGCVLVVLDKLPDGWQWRRAWFGADQIEPILCRPAP